MRKILLVNTNTETRPYPVPPSGLCMLAGILSEKREVRVFDGAFTPHTELIPLLHEFKPDYIGFSIRNVDDMTYDKLNYYIDDIFIKFIKPVQEITQTPLILGGSGFSIFPQELLHLYKIPFGIAGEAEVSLPRLLDAIDNGLGDSVLPGVHYLNKETFIQSAPQVGRIHTQASEVDRWIDYAPYRSRGAYGIQTKRGCGFRCIYCTYPGIEGCSYRLRTPVEIVDELQLAVERLGNITFEFTDSIFNDPPGHAEDICREIIRRELRPRLRTMGINPGYVNTQLLELMLQAGFTQIDCTPDSASPEMLKNLGKNFGFEDLVQTAKQLQNLDFPTMWFFLLGGPGESPETLRQTFLFIEKYINPDDLVHLTCRLRIYPGTALEQQALREGQISPGQNLLKPVFYLSPDLKADEMQEMINEQCRRFPNCVQASESAPPADMMKEALQQRELYGLTEPMFRTLLRIKRSRI